MDLLARYLAAIESGLPPGTVTGGSHVRKSRSRFVLALSVAALLAVAGCGGSSNSSSGSSSSNSSSSSSSSSSGGADKTLAGQVPSKYKSKGSLTFAEDASYAPNEFIGSDGKTVVGMDADLANAIARVLGLKANVQNASFDAIIPGLSSGKYDVGLSSFTDTKEREKTVDFVTYFSAGTSFYTKAQGGPNVQGLADLCGLTVAAEKGTTQAADATAQSKKCTSAGKKPVTVQTYPDQNGANLALSSGRAQVGMADSPVAAYQVKKSNGQFKLTGKTYGTAPYGIALPKNSGLAQPFLGAVKKLIADGQYKKILDKWGIQQGAITNPTINGAIS
jgi:polar amino acid transport system substrate-binding protein